MPLFRSQRIGIQRPKRQAMEYSVSPRIFDHVDDSERPLIQGPYAAPAPKPAPKPLAPARVHHRTPRRRTPGPGDQHQDQLSISESSVLSPTEFNAPPDSNAATSRKAPMTASAVPRLPAPANLAVLLRAGCWPRPFRTRVDGATPLFRRILSRPAPRQWNTACPASPRRHPRVTGAPASEALQASAPSPARRPTRPGDDRSRISGSFSNESRCAVPGVEDESDVCPRKAPIRARRGADAQATLADGRERAGVRCGRPAPLRHPCALEFQHNASAWRAGCPYRIPALGAGTKHLFRTLILRYKRI